jgi:hypothetical protein
MNGLHPEDSSLAALFLGFGGGYSLMLHSFPFSARGPVNGRPPAFWMYAARYVLGLAGAGAIYLGLRLLFPGEGSLLSGIPGWGGDTAFYDLGRFIRYALVGLWASVGAPRLFLTLGIAGGTGEAPASGVTGAAS